MISQPTANQKSLSLILGLIVLLITEAFVVGRALA